MTMVSSFVSQHQNPPQDGSFIGIPFFILFKASKNFINPLFLLFQGQLLISENSNLGVQIRKISSKLFSCDATVGTKNSVSQTYSISDLGFIKTPLWAVQSSNWLNAQITNITKDSISITFYNPSERGIAGTAAWIQLIFLEPK